MAWRPKDDELKLLHTRKDDLSKAIDQQNAALCDKYTATRAEIDLKTKRDLLLGKLWVGYQQRRSNDQLKLIYPEFTPPVSPECPVDIYNLVSNSLTQTLRAADTKKADADRAVEDSRRNLDRIFSQLNAPVACNALTASGASIKRCIAGAVADTPVRPGRQLASEAVITCYRQRPVWLWNCC